MKKPIYVNQPTLPPLGDFIPYLEEIWLSKALTNGGRFHQELEGALCQLLGIKNISLFSNGTIALITALKALNISGEVLTTPFTFVATTHSLIWNGLTPVFVDIDPSTLNLDPDKIERSITEKTSAIMPVHCYGSPCEIDKIKSIAEKYNLKIIYDAAHAFGVKDSGGSILRHGDLSVLSFHATKVFNTFEGGAIVSSSASQKLDIDRLKNFGFEDEVTINTVGINGKMSEINAAFGLLQLKGLDSAIAKRQRIDDAYRIHLEELRGIVCPKTLEGITGNFSYFPILIQEAYQLSRDELHQKLRNSNIFARRYFFPLISNLPMYQKLPSANYENLKVANKIASQIICLPIFSDMTTDMVEEICLLIKGA